MASKNKPIAGATALTVDVPMSAADVAALQKAAEHEHAFYAGIMPADVDTPDDYVFVDKALTAVVQRKDAATAMRKSVTGPLYEVIKTVEGWFRPYLAELDFAESQCKAAMGAYRTREAEAEQAARDLAAEAAKVGDGETLAAALNAATEIAADAKPEDASASCTFKWVVDRINVDLLPGYKDDGNHGLDIDSVWVPNEARFHAIARRTNGGDEPPVIPGVVWKRAAQIGASR